MESTVWLNATCVGCALRCVVFGWAWCLVGLIAAQRTSALVRSLSNTMIWHHQAVRGTPHVSLNNKNTSNRRKQYVLLAITTLPRTLSVDHGYLSGKSNCWFHVGFKVAGIVRVLHVVLSECPPTVTMQYGSLVAFPNILKSLALSLSPRTTVTRATPNRCTSARLARRGKKNSIHGGKFTGAGGSVPLLSHTSCVFLSCVAAGVRRERRWEGLWSEKRACPDEGEDDTSGVRGAGLRSIELEGDGSGCTRKGVTRRGACVCLLPRPLLAPAGAAPGLGSTSDPRVALIVSHQRSNKECMVCPLARP